MKITLLLPLFLLLSLSMFGQSLRLGAVVFSLPVSGAYEFALMAGGYQSQAQAPVEFNGFHYGNGTFHLWKNGGPGVCLTGPDPNVPGCRFDGTMGKLIATPLDEDCTQISFPITDGELRILQGGWRNCRSPECDCTLLTDVLRHQGQLLHGWWNSGGAIELRAPRHCFF